MAGGGLEVRVVSDNLAGRGERALPAFSRSGGQPVGFGMRTSRSGGRVGVGP